MSLMANGARHANFLYVGQHQQKTAVLIPVKPFNMAKSRLSPVRSPSDREAIAKRMLRNVLAAAQGLRVAIVAPSLADDVRRFALVNGTRFIAEPAGGGLDGAVQFGVEQLARSDYDRVIVVHSDIPGVRDVSWMADTDGVIVVPDRTGQGTNALSVPTAEGFRFSYGPGSFERHCEEARRLGFDPKVVVDPEGLSADIDEPEDLQNASALLKPIRF